MKLRSILGLLDHFFCKSVTKESVTAALEGSHLYSQDHSIAEIDSQYASIDAKASSLLQHISMMITSLSIIYSLIQVPLIKFIIMAKIMLYLLTLLLVLRVLYYLDYEEIGTKESRFILMQELSKKIIYYKIAHAAASILTVALVIVIFLIELYGR